MPNAAKHARRFRSARVVWQGGASVASNARLILPAMAREYFVIGREVVAADLPVKELHAFRLATKRFRYTLELFRDFYGPSLDRRLKLLKPIQDALGDVNDCVATHRALGDGHKASHYLSRRAEHRKRAFARRWKNEFDAPGREAAWVGYLARVARRGAREIG